MFALSEIKMMCARLCRAFALCGLLAALGCKPIPTSPDAGDNGVFDGLSYFNEAWGFQISRPNAQWAINAETFVRARDINGLAPVTVRISSPVSPESAGEFRPQMRLYPRALPDDMTLVQLARDFEAEYLMPRFDQYRVIDEKQRVQLKVGEAIQWQFCYSQLERPNREYPGTRFLIAVSIHNQVGYYMIGNGSGDASYPLEEYRQIVASLGFQ